MTAVFNSEWRLARGFSRCYDDCISKEMQQPHNHQSDLLSKIKEFIEEDQFGFWKGTRDAIGLMRIESGTVFDVKEDMCLCFVD